VARIGAQNRGDTADDRAPALEKIWSHFGNNPALALFR
jgi:hypothetical protein